MKKEWISFLDKITEEIEKMGIDFPIFRGHNNSQWKLIPSLHREPWISKADPSIEENILAEFMLYSGPLYEKKLDNWELLFEMRHSGIPTRLLDWTEHFGSALFFALNGINWENNGISHAKINPCIWIMNPYALNETFLQKAYIPFVNELKFDYEDLLTINSKNSDKIANIKGPIAILPPRMLRRSFAQKSIFTLHMGSYEPIEKICKSCVKKFEIPSNSINEAYSFLKMAGINDYSLYPDTDGLGKYIVKKYKS